MSEPNKSQNNVVSLGESFVLFMVAFLHTYLVAILKSDTLQKSHTHLQKSWIEILKSLHTQCTHKYIRTIHNHYQL